MEEKANGLMELFKEKLNPFIKVKADAEKKLSALRSAVTACEKEIDRKNSELAKTVLASIEEIGEGKPSQSDKKLIQGNETKASLDMAQMRLNGLQQAIEDAERSVRNATDKLSTELQGTIGLFRDEKVKEANVFVQQAISMGVDWIETVDQIFRDLRVSVPSYVKEDCMKFFVFKNMGINLENHIREFLYIPEIKG